MAIPQGQANSLGDFQLNLMEFNGLFVGVCVCVPLTDERHSRFEHINVKFELQFVVIVFPICGVTVLTEPNVWV